MKFGKQIKRLAVANHLHHYIAYDVLKKAINVIVEAGSGRQESAEYLEEVTETFGASCSEVSYQPANSRFHGLVQHELVKVNRFFALQLRLVLDKFKEAQRALLSCAQGSSLEEKLDTAEGHLDAAAQELTHLENFRRLNFTGFRKIAKKFDKAVPPGSSQASLSSYFMPSLAREFFAAAPMDAHVLALSLGYAALRRYRRGSQEAFAPVRSQGTEPAATKTFWVMHAAGMMTLCTLVKRFELVVPPAPGALVPSDMSTQTGEAFVAQMQKLIFAMGTDGLAQVPCCIATETARTYFDSPGQQFPHYSRRVQQGGQIDFHCRRSSSAAGGRSSGTGMDVVEKDGACSALSVHAFTPISQPCSYDAFPIVNSRSGTTAAGLVESAAAAQKVAKDGSLAPTLGQAGCRNLAAFAQQVTQAAAGSASLTPVATVSCKRFCFKGDTSATKGVTIALDEDVRLSDGAAGPDDGAIDFPYHLLEVADEDSSKAKWLEELRGDAALRNIPGFNIGAHAVASLHKDAIPSLPAWWDHLENVETSAPAEAFGIGFQMREAIKECGQDEDGQDGTRMKPPPVLPPDAPAVLPGGDLHADDTDSEDDNKCLEPKNLLASERTMLEWMHTVFALALVGIGLWKFSLKNQRGKGLLNTTSTSSTFLGIYSLFLVGLAVVFCWYAVLTHFARIKAMVSGEITERVFNKRIGPTLFGLSLGMALIAHLAVQAIPLMS